MSTMKGEELSNLAEALAGYNARQAVNARPVMPQVSNLARVLASVPAYRPPVQVTVPRRADASE